ncbi:hypothetical protein TNCV_4163701 [Trichonephila clavipes]|nr:hypothetical protein TNCV_4163701 [Trichonephila clavipes]
MDVENGLPAIILTTSSDLGTKMHGVVGGPGSKTKVSHPICTNFRIEAHGRDQRKPLFLPSHGLDTEEVEEHSRSEIMLSQSKVPIELAFFFMVSVTNNITLTST